MAGRPEHEYSDKIAAQLESLITFGIPQEDIASYVGISIKTLKKHYADIFENCKECRHAKVKHALFYQATKLNIPASTIFYLKTQCSDEFSEKPKENVDEGTVQDDILSTVADNYLPD